MKASGRRLRVPRHPANLGINCFFTFFSTPFYSSWHLEERRKLFQNAGQLPTTFPLSFRLLQSVNALRAYTISFFFGQRKITSTIYAKTYIIVYTPALASGVSSLLVKKKPLSLRWSRSLAHRSFGVHSGGGALDMSNAHDTRCTPS